MVVNKGKAGQVPEVKAPAYHMWSGYRAVLSGYYVPKGIDKVFFSFGSLLTHAYYYIHVNCCNQSYSSIQYIWYMPIIYGSYNIHDIMRCTGAIEICHQVSGARVRILPVWDLFISLAVHFLVEFSHVSCKQA